MLAHGSSATSTGSRGTNGVGLHGHSAPASHPTCGESGSCSCAGAEAPRWCGCRQVYLKLYLRTRFAESPGELDARELEVCRMAAKAMFTPYLTRCSNPGTLISRNSDITLNRR